MLNKIEASNKSFDTEMISITLSKVILSTIILIVRDTHVMGVIPRTSLKLVESMPTISMEDAVDIVTMNSNKVVGDMCVNYGTHTPYADMKPFASLTGAEYLPSKVELEKAVVDPMNRDSKVSLLSMIKRYGFYEEDILQSLDFMVCLDPSLEEEDVGVITYANDGIVYRTLCLSISALVFCLIDIPNRGGRHNAQTRLDKETIFRTVATSNSHKN